MIPQYSWRCDGMRVRAPTDAASEKARDRGEAKRQYAAQQMDLPSRTDASNRKHFLPSRSAAPDADSQGLQSHQWSHARPTPFTASRCPRHPAAHVAPPEASPHRAAEPAPPTTLPKVINKGAAPRPPRPWHQHEADPGAQKQKYAQNCNFFAIANCREASKRGLKPGKAANRTHSGPFPPRGGRKGVRNHKKVAQKSEFFVSAKRIVATEQFLRKTRVPSMPIRPSSSTEPQRIDHTSTHALTLGKDPALARLKNATSEEKRWAK